MNGASPFAVEVRALAKTFPGRRKGFEMLRPWRKPEGRAALRGVDVTLRSGEIVALLGPNGAGKTTLLEILATLIRPTSGEAFVDGIDIVRNPDRARERIGYVIVEERSFFWRLSARENLRFFAALGGIHGKVADRRIVEVVALLGLRDELDVRFMELSSGQKQRMAIRVDSFRILPSCSSTRRRARSIPAAQTACGASCALCSSRKNERRSSLPRTISRRRDRSRIA